MSGAGAARAVIEAAWGEGRQALSEVESAALLASFGIPVAPSRIARAETELEVALAIGGPPWVLKIASPDIAHKTEVGGVVRGVRDPAEARAAFRDLVSRVGAARPGARIDGVLVQPEVGGAVAELILGAFIDAQFGPVVLVGLGGILAETLDDTALRVAPIDEAEGRRMLDELRGARLLHGFRGRPPADVAPVARALAALSRLAVELEGWVAEVDVNPLLVCPEGRGAVAVDALVGLASALVAQPSGPG